MSGESQSVEEAIDGLAYPLRSIATAICADGMPGHDATGGTVMSLTEAAMGITAALTQVASAISELAEAVRERGGA